MTIVLNISGDTWAIDTAKVLNGVEVDILGSVLVPTSSQGRGFNQEVRYRVRTVKPHRTEGGRPLSREWTVKLEELRSIK